MYNRSQYLLLYAHQPISKVVVFFLTFNRFRNKRTWKVKRWHLNQHNSLLHYRPYKKWNSLHRKWNMNKLQNQYCFHSNHYWLLFQQNMNYTFHIGSNIKNGCWWKTKGHDWDVITLLHRFLNRSKCSIFYSIFHIARISSMESKVKEGQC